jgi:hypothetical protein
MTKMKRLLKLLAVLVMLPGLVAAIPPTERVSAGGHPDNFTALNGAAPLSPLATGDEMWSGRFELGADDSIYAIVTDPSGDIYVGGDFTHIAGISANHVAHWSASTGRWSPLGTGISSHVYALALSGNYLYAAGFFSVAGGWPANSIARWDFTTNAWSAVGSGLAHAGAGATGRALAADGTGGVYVGGQFDSAGGVYCQNISHWTGSIWKGLAGGLGTTGDSVNALVVNGTDIYAGGLISFPAGNIALWTGSTWVTLGSGANGEVFALALQGTNLFVGGNFSTVTDPSGSKTVNTITYWDGVRWNTMGNGLDGPEVDAIAVGPDGIYVGGRFTQGSGTQVSRVARWYNSAWYPVKNPASASNGVDSSVYALAARGFDLYVGGGFSHAADWDASYLARWNVTAQQWYSPGNAPNGPVQAVVTTGSYVFIGGDFSSAGGVAVNGIAYYNKATSAWLAMGTGLQGCNGPSCRPVVNAMAIKGSKVYVGGNFTTAGGVTVNNVASWDLGSLSWSAMSGGVTNCTGASCVTEVLTLAPDGSGVDVGGWFTNAGALTANNAAVWNGSAWNTFTDAGHTHTGTNGPVYAIAKDSLGGYNIGGEFTLPLTNYVHFDGSSWSSFPSAPNDAVRSIVVSGSSVTIGGDFTNAGGSGANYIAMASGTGNWTPLDGSLDAPVYAMAFQGSRLIVGGAFTLANGAIGANHIASWNGSTWSSLGSGVDLNVLSLAVDNNFFYTGGDFHNAGLKPASFLARWGLYSTYMPRVSR